MNEPTAAAQPAVQGRARTTGSGQSFVYAGPQQIQLNGAPLLSTRRAAQSLDHAVGLSGTIRQPAVTEPTDESRSIQFESVGLPVSRDLSGINRITARRVASDQQPAAWADLVQPSATIDFPVDSGAGEEVEDADTAEFIAGLQAMSEKQETAIDWPAVNLVGQAQPAEEPAWHVREQSAFVPETPHSESKGWSVRESPLSAAEFQHLTTEKSAYQPFDVLPPQRKRRMRWAPAFLMAAVIGISVVTTLGFHPYQQNNVAVEKANLVSAPDPRAANSQNNTGQVNSGPGISVQQTGPDTTTTAATPVSKVPTTGANDPPIGYATIAVSVLLLMGGMLFFFRAREKGVIEIVARGAAGYQIPVRY